MIESPSASADLRALRERLGERYSVERELGRGGMGAVYLARDVRLDRLVALKVLPPEFAVQATLRDRFLRETRTAASFSHPNIVPVYAVEESDDFLAYAMGYVEGESVMERVRRAGPLTVRETVKMMQDVAYALAYAHGRGIVHRDIKPDNIMLDRASGRALVMDFGIARAKSNAPVPAKSAGLTRVGEVVGTPEYMSPEQASGDDVDGRSDLYSLGLTVMFALTGKQAVTGETTQKVLVKQLTEALPSISTLRAELPGPLAAAVDRCVLKNPADRYDTAEGLVEAIDEAQLMAPEVPLGIRLFAQELSGLSVVLVAALIVVAMVLRSLRNTDKDADLFLVIVLTFAVLFTRALQTLKEVSRVALSGFSAEEIIVGVRRVVDEREVGRQELRTDATVVRARRRTVIMAAAMLVAAVPMAYVASSLRVRVSPTEYYVGYGGMMMFFSAIALFGVGLVLGLKSPLRMPLGERMFRLVWLGPIGRAFVRFGTRGVAGARHPIGSPASSPVSRRLVATPIEARQPLPVAVPVEMKAQVPGMMSAVPDHRPHLHTSESVPEVLRDVNARLERVEGRLAALEGRSVDHVVGSVVVAAVLGSAVLGSESSK